MPEQNRAATDAVRASAEQLGVDPFRFARFLQDGRLADLVTALARRDPQGPDGATLARLSHEYARFLEQEEELGSHGADGPGAIRG